jgi:outer membrane protein insertion porin family
LTEGRRFDFAAWQADRQRLIGFYQAQGFFEVRVQARRLTAAPASGVPAATVGGDELTLEYTIERGIPTRLDVSGFDLPADIRQRIIERWTTAVFDRFLERDATLIVREYLYGQGRLQATVNAAVQRGSAVDAKTLRITIDPGAVAMPRLVFEGNAMVSTATLVETAQRAGPLAAWLDPASFGQVIKRLYLDEGLLSADVNVHAAEVQEGASVVRVVIREGEAWQIGRVSVAGADALADAGGVNDIGLTAGARYDPKTVAERAAALEQRLRDAGFLSVRVTTDTSLDASTRSVDVRVAVDPGPRSVLTAVSIEGADPNSAAIRRSVDLAVGKPVSPSAMSATRRRLYENGAFGGVDIELEPVDGSPPGDRSAAQRNVAAKIRVEERPRYSFRYGLAFNDTVTTADERERRLGFAADLENRNVLGRGASVGLSARLRQDQEVGRVFFGTSRFLGLPIRSNLFLARSRQQIGSDDGFETVSDVTEISAEQTYRLRRLVDVRYGYNLGRNRTTNDALDFDVAVRVARLTMSGVLDRRSDPFDPTHGSFTSASFELSRPGLGSELSFVRSFLQQLQFVPVGHGIVVASGVRLGLARAFRDETLIPSERFFAGGATSVRGYADNGLGPRSVLGDAAGGSGLFIANGEMRFPIYKWLKGVTFVDVGNVYAEVGDMLRSRPQIGAGGGMRLNTPVGLFRFDLAIPVNPGTLESGWTSHFGLGHAF